MAESTGQASPGQGGNKASISRDTDTQIVKMGGAPHSQTDGQQTEFKRFRFQEEMWWPIIYSIPNQLTPARQLWGCSCVSSWVRIWLENRIIVSDGGAELVSPSHHLTHHNQVRLGPSLIFSLHLHNIQQQHQQQIREITWHRHSSIKFYIIANLKIW